MDLGLSGNLTIINATPFTWQRTFQHAYQMIEWDLPNQIAPGEIRTVSTQWGFLGKMSDDAAETGYSFNTPGGQVGFQVQARYAKAPQLKVLLDRASTFGNPQGSSIDLGFVDYEDTPFIFSGRGQGSFGSTNPPMNWMQQSLPNIGCLPLNRICVPASHDSGMSHFNGKTAFATPENTLTHYTDVAGQLQAGFRFFDVRPVISKGQFFTGHYSEIIGVWQGGNGQSIASIIDQVNAFLDKNKEMVIINLSHNLDTDNGYTSFSQDEQDQLFKQLLRLKYRYVAPANARDLSTLKLNDIIGTGPAVLIILDNAQANEHMNAGSFPNQGFYTNS
jgi:hypothetical protein